MLAQVVLGLALFAQQPPVGRQATPEDLTPGLTEVPSPMLLEVSLGANGDRRSFSDPDVAGRTFYETKAFVCDEATVPFVTVKKRTKGRNVELEVSPLLKTGHYRQDIDVTVAVLSGGKEVRRKVWNDFTIGADDSWANKVGMWAAAPSSSKRPIAAFEFKAAEWEALFAGAGAPTVRLILDIQE